MSAPYLRVRKSVENLLPRRASETRLPAKGPLVAIALKRKEELDSTMSKRTSRIGRENGMPFLHRVAERRRGGGEDQTQGHSTVLTALFNSMNEFQQDRRASEMAQHRGAAIKEEAERLESESKLRETNARIMRDSLEKSMEIIQNGRLSAKIKTCMLRSLGLDELASCVETEETSK